MSEEKTPKMSAGEKSTQEEKPVTSFDLLMQGVELLAKLMEHTEGQEGKSQTDEQLPEWHKEVSRQLRERFNKKEGFGVFMYADVATNTGLENFLFQVGGHPNNLKKMLRAAFKADDRFRAYVLEALLER